MTNQLVINEIIVDGYEKVVEFTNDEIGFRAIIAIHNTKLGPALGGIRAYAYKSLDAALSDVLRLSKGMTYKSAVSESETGGGKSVIILSDGQSVNEKLLSCMGEAINSLNGLYIGAEDVGVSVAHVHTLSKYTSYLVGREEISGDPSIFTSLGVFRAIHAAAQVLFGSESLEGKKVAIQGLGSVGSKLAELVHNAGGSLVVADVNQAIVKEICDKFNAESVHVDDILSVKCDILSPCALGGILNEKSIPTLSCKAIAGAANNQLLTANDGNLIHDMGILYVPDYIANAGGLINVAQEISSLGYSSEVSRSKIQTVIYDSLIKILSKALEDNISPAIIADQLAESRFSESAIC